MQENIKIEKKAILSPTLTLDVIMKKLIDETEKGKESAQMIRNILDNDLHQRSGLKDVADDQDYSKALDHHSMVVLTSFVTSLSLMKSCDFDNDDQDLIKKRKVDHMYDNDNDNGDVPNKILTNTSKDGRGCYKRRKSGEARVKEVTQLRDDGFNWRKYGQKVILNANHPRNYYRCSHKYDQKCQAAKQVQQISENPTKYRIIYHGNHTCNNNNILKFSPIIINDDTASDEQHHSSAIVLSFNEKNQENPFLFPEPDSVKQEFNSSDQATSLDPTATTALSSSTFVSDLISTAENCCSSTIIQDDEGVEDYSSMWTDLGIHDLY